MKLYSVVEDRTVSVQILGLIYVDVTNSLCSKTRRVGSTARRLAEMGREETRALLCLKKK